jgi:hypothetical protein
MAELPEVPIGPPLGLGGLPFETTEFELPEGSLLVLHTDGLIADRTRDVDLALATLHDVLTSAPESLEETCDQGTRHGREGKVIWAEQALPTGSGPTTGNVVMTDSVKYT